MQLILHLTCIRIGTMLPRSHPIMITLLLIPTATLLQPYVPIIKQDHQAHHQRDSNTGVLQVDRRVDISHLVTRSTALHRSVVHGHEQDDELAEMADIGTVVVIGLCEGEIDQVVQQEADRQPQDYQGGELVLI